MEDQPELLRLLRQHRALLREPFQLLLHFAKRGRLGGAIGLQVFLIGLQLLLERLDQTFDRLLPLHQLALRHLLESAKRLFGQP